MRSCPLYEVSDHGRIRSLHGSSPRIMKTFDDGRGYQKVHLYDGEGGRERRYVHRLVALAFLGPPPSEEHEVNHLDSDPENNCASNLQWVTRSENIQHGYEQGRGEIPPPRFGEDHHNSQLTELQVAEMRRLYRSSDMSQGEVGACFGVSQSTAHSILVGETWKRAGGPIPE